MAILGSLPNLEILKLLGKACEGGTWETTDEEFPRLKYLLIDGSHLEQWITQSNPLPTLKRLVLRSCWNLREIPEDIGEISTLELIEVEYCTTSLVESAKKIKEDQESCGNDVLQVVCASHDEDYMRTGMYRFGDSKSYNHPKQGVGSSAPVALNFIGYPLRPGEKECPYYVKTGQCKFGVTCKFHHPELSASAAAPAVAMYPTRPSPSFQSSHQFGVIQGNWPVAMLQGSYVPGSYGPMILPPACVPVPGWTPYPAPVSPAASPSTQPTIGAPSATAYTVTGPYISTTTSSTQQAFPERPGQPECQFYLRTGDCKFGVTCKYHHPPQPQRSLPRTNYVLSPVGLPLRPGAPLCSHYARNGVCKFEASCKFDHPMISLSYRPFAS